MAARRTTNTTAGRKSNTDSYRTSNRSGMYVDGSAVRRLQEIPEREYPQRQRERRTDYEEPERKVRDQKSQRELNRAIQKNRAKAADINKRFVLFLTGVCIAVMFVTINYLQLKSQITTRMKQVANLETELTSMKEENDAYYSQVTNNVDMSRIKKIAIGRLGMKYPADDQTETYQTARSSYVRQYQDIPDMK